MVPGYTNNCKFWDFTVEWIFSFALRFVFTPYLAFCFYVYCSFLISKFYMTWPWILLQKHLLNRTFLIIISDLSLIQMNDMKWLESSMHKKPMKVMLKLTDVTETTLTKSWKVYNETKAWTGGDRSVLYWRSIPVPG